MAFLGVLLCLALSNDVLCFDYLKSKVLKRAPHDDEKGTELVAMDRYHTQHLIEPRDSEPLYITKKLFNECKIFASLQQEFPTEKIYSLDLSQKSLKLCEKALDNQLPLNTLSFDELCTLYFSEKYLEIPLLSKRIIKNILSSKRLSDFKKSALADHLVNELSKDNYLREKYISAFCHTHLKYQYNGSKTNYYFNFQSSGNSVSGYIPALCEINFSDVSFKVRFQIDGKKVLMKVNRSDFEELLFDGFIEVKLPIIQANYGLLRNSLYVVVNQHGGSDFIKRQGFVFDIHSMYTKALKSIDTCTKQEFIRLLEVHTQKVRCCV